MYDTKRATNYNKDNCKHLACTEVRAALFHSECLPKANKNIKFLKNTKLDQEKMTANEFCVRELAI